MADSARAHKCLTFANMEEYMLNKNGDNHRYSSYSIDMGHKHVILVSDVLATLLGRAQASTDDDSSRTRWLLDSFLDTYGKQVRELSLECLMRRGRLWQVIEMGSSAMEILSHAVLIEGRMPHLRDLTVHAVFLADDITSPPRTSPTNRHGARPPTLRVMKYLRHLTIRGVTGVDESGQSVDNISTAAFPSVCPPGLLSLHMYDCCGFRLADLMELPLPPSALTTLKVMCNKSEEARLTAEEVAMLGGAFPCLKDLQIAVGVQGSQVWLRFPEDFPHLIDCHLDLAGSEVGLLYLGGMPALATLTLEGMEDSFLACPADADSQVWAAMHKLSIAVGRGIYDATSPCIRVHDTCSSGEVGQWTRFPALNILNLTRQLVSGSQLRTIFEWLPRLEELRAEIDASADPALTGWSAEKCKFVSRWQIVCLCPSSFLRWWDKGRKVAGPSTISISSLKRLTKLELICNEPDFVMYSGIMYGITDCTSLEDLSLKGFALTGRHAHVYEAIPAKLGYLKQLDLNVLSTTERIERNLHLRLDSVRIRFHGHRLGRTWRSWSVRHWRRTTSPANPKWSPIFDPVWRYSKDWPSRRRT